MPSLTAMEGRPRKTPWTALQTRSSGRSGHICTRRISRRTTQLKAWKRTPAQTHLRRARQRIPLRIPEQNSRQWAKLRCFLPQNQRLR